jgi:transposase InsO family protein
MLESSVYKWEEIRKYFPPERIAKFRADILKLRESGKYTDEKLWKEYGMSERAFYDLIAREKEDTTIENLRDKSSKPHNPHRKLTDEDIAEIVNLRMESKNSIESAKCTFIETMEKSDNKNLPSSKLEPLLKLMEKAAKGVRRIAAVFNKRKENGKRPTRISKSRVHQILTKAGLTGEKKVPEPLKHLHRPEEPLLSFAMDYTQKRIGTGETVYAFGLLDMFNSGIVILDAHTEKSGENVKGSLHQLREIVPSDVIIDIRSDAGSEFNNEIVGEYYKENNIMHHILPKAHPWLNAFLERAIETLQYEFINLQYYASFEDFKKFLGIARIGYNQREHSSFNYRSPLEVWITSGISKALTAGGLWT